MMFNIMAEMLAIMMTKAARKGKLKGAMSHIIPEGALISNMHMTLF
jgi:hypothetical protein